MTTGTKIHDLTETTSLAENDEFPLYYSTSPGNRKVTRANLRKTLFASPVTGTILQYNGSDWVVITPGALIDALTAASTFADADNVLISQGGAAKKITRANLRKLLLDSPAANYVPIYNGTDWIASPTGSSTFRNATLGSPGFNGEVRVGRTSAGVTDWIACDGTGFSQSISITSGQLTSGSYTITTTQTSCLQVGSPIRWTFGAKTYRGVVTSINAGVSFTFSGPAPEDTISQNWNVDVGRSSMVQHVHLLVEGTNYAVSTGDILASIGHRYYTWRGPTAYLVGFSATHATATAPAINVKINGTAVGTSALTLNSTPGTWAHCTNVVRTAYDINLNEAIEINVTSAVASSSYLNVMLTFVLE